MTNWRHELEELMNGEDVLEFNIAGDMYYPEMLDAALERLGREFDGGHGGNEGESFWAWTATSVYFCVDYDGAEWIAKIPRNPQLGTPCHIG